MGWTRTCVSRFYNTFQRGFRAVITVILLILSNAFMTMAWYGHLKFKAAPLALAILVSWLIALPEYMLQVPANRLGHADEGELPVGAVASATSSWWHAKFSAPQLKILQEIITISVFVVFNFLYLQERIRLTDWAAFGLILLAVVVMMYPRMVAEKAGLKTASVSLLPEDLAIGPVDGKKV
jgi:uncharacterized protein (DUF486 family)